MPFTISAANDLLVEYDAHRWALLLPSAPATPIVEADAQTVRYASAFGIARRLGSLGGLRPDQVSMVVVGYSSEDRNWHLGLMLDAALAQGRGGRWCELAQWPDDEETDAETAGRKLAAVIGRPFRLVTPQSPLGSSTSMPAAPASAYSNTSAGANLGTYTPAPTPAMPPPDYQFGEVTRPLPPQIPVSVADTPVSPAQAAAPEPPLQPLPLTFGEWTAQEILGGMQWSRTSKWRNDQIVRGLFFCVLAPIFAYLSIGALATNFAAVQPLWLPWVGVALALVMLLIGLSSFWAIWGSPITTVDRRIQMLRQTKRGSKKVVQSPFEGLEYVLVSHSITRQQPIDDQLLLAILDVWVHVYSPRRGFLLVCSTDNVEAQLSRKADYSTRHALSLRDTDSLAHHAALHLAQDIGIPAYIEER
ncbi:MAG: hypothetical protein U0528_09445 [Anaerolineae bacterium]|nr:hypothetical protein [Anaerolineae bacterium]